MAGFTTSRFHTDDIEVAAERMTGEFGRVEVVGERLVYDEHQVGDERFTIATLRLTGTFSGSAELHRPAVATGSGVYRWQDGDEGGDLSEPVLFQRGRPVQRTVEDLASRVVSFEPRALERLARLLYADDTLTVRFDGAHAVSVADGARWTSAAALAAEATEPVLEGAMVRTAFYRVLAVTLLECFRLVGDPVARRISAEQRLRAYRAAAEFLHDRAAAPVTLEDAAEVAGVSTAELDLAFRAHSPDGADAATHLCRIRLAGARADLLAADPTLGATVTAIALRWGFPHAGRFAGLYRRTYGVNPRADLDR